MNELLLIAALAGGLAVALVYFVFASFVFGAGYQPAPRRVVTMMLDKAAVGPSDYMFDLGAGTGAIVFRAARERGARVLGVEVEPLRVAVLRLRRRFGGPKDRVQIAWGNLFTLNFRDATVVAVFLWPGAMEKLRPIFEAQLRPGARVVSHWHPVPGWEPESVDRETRVYLYRRPG
ncbi:MAG: SAM-dependent methyltransferase [Candidatus Lutacidiplasmatales archaeon]